MFTSKNAITLKGDSQLDKQITNEVRVYFCGLEALNINENMEEVRRFLGEGGKKRST